MSTDANKELVRRWFAETDRGNDAIVDELCAADYVDHSPPLPGMPAGNAGVRQANAALREAFPDTVHFIEDQIAEGDKVVTRWTARGTHRGDLLGRPGSGDEIAFSGINIYRIADGRLAESHVNWDLLGIAHQLGASDRRTLVD